LGLTDVVNGTVKFLPKDSHASVFGPHMRMIVCPVEKRVRTISIRDDPKDAAHRFFLLTMTLLSITKGNKAVNPVDRNVPRKPRAVRGVKGHPAFSGTGKPRPLAGELQ
jgi:hypothetical protein